MVHVCTKTMYTLTNKNEINVKYMILYYFLMALYVQL